MAPAARSSASAADRVLKSSSGKSPDQVNRRNARERKRVEQINMSFRTLAHRLAAFDPVKNRKISKVETLKCAVDYIKHLEKLLSGACDFEMDDTESFIKREVSMSPEQDPGMSSASSTFSMDHSFGYGAYSQTGSVSPPQTSHGYDSGYPSPTYCPTTSMSSGCMSQLPTPQGSYYTAHVQHPTSLNAIPSGQWRGSPMYGQPAQNYAYVPTM